MFSSICLACFLMQTGRYSLDMVLLMLQAINVPNFPSAQDN